MKKYNVIIVYSNDEKNILFCRREKEPYKGMFNLVGGKIEDGEESSLAAYRELEEETGISKEDITLTHVMDMNYELKNMSLEIYAGKLNKNKEVIDEVNKLYWIDSKDDFYSNEKYAGEGNIGHMVKQVELNKDIVLK